MTVLPKCPSCGLESPEIRCPRCNALKIVGCDGVCSACASNCPAASVLEPAAGGASDECAEGSEKARTPGA